MKWWRRATALLLPKTLIMIISPNIITSFILHFCCKLKCFQFFTITHSLAWARPEWRERGVMNYPKVCVFGMWGNRGKIFLQCAYVDIDDSTGSFFKLPTWQDKTRNNWKQSDLTFNHFSVTGRSSWSEKESKSVLKEIGLDFSFFLK